MVTTDYTSLVSREPPEGLLDWALQGVDMNTAGFVYKKIWLQDASVDAVLTGKCAKVPAVQGTCSECGKETVFDYAQGRKTYGFISNTGAGGYCSALVVDDEDYWECPHCGHPVKVKKAASIRREGYVTDEDFVVSASTLPGEYGKRPLVLTQWRIQRLTTKEAETKYNVEPIDAYVFEEKDACRLRGWSTSYSGHGGYFMAVSRQWTQARDWHDEMGRGGEIFGLTRELVEESCLHNSKLDLFMQIKYGYKLPVGYLRLYQQYPQVENLVVQGCGHILTRIFENLVQTDAWEKNKRGMVEMPSELHLEETRPAQMLGLNKDELRVMLDQRWDLYHWKIYVKAKAAGDKMKIPEDIELVHRYGAEDVERIIGMAPVGKTVRYLMRQIETTGIEMLEVADPEGECDDDLLDLLSASHLADYWKMAETVGWDLSDPEVRWPKDLIDAHDRAMAARNVVLSKKKCALIRKRAKNLADYAYTSGDLTIFPAGSQKALNEEGAKLHHCVAGYGEDIADGLTTIFFIRHTWAPKEPFFTLEYKDGAVAQNRGLHNCSRTKEVKTFEAEWLRWIKKGRPRDKDGRPRGAAPEVKEKPKDKEANVA